jgi:putative ABC transport system permease protein
MQIASMFRNYFRLAIRRLRKTLSFTLLNILGLTLGLTTFLLIVVYVTDELSFDRYNTKADRIVRVQSDTYLNGVSSDFAIAAPAVAGVLAKSYPEIEKVTRILPVRDLRMINARNQEMEEKNLAYCDPAVFDVFTLPFIEGSPATALQNPGSAVLTESTALRYFNSTHVIGQSIRVVGDTLLTVTAVIRDIPVQSHFHFDFLLSLPSLEISRNPSFYVIQPCATYVLLKPGASAQTFNKKLAEFMGTWDKDYKEFAESDFRFQLYCIPLTDIHLRSDRTDEIEKNSSIQYVYVFSIIALFVLLIACINFMNLSTAQSANRAREVGVRKVLGSARSQLAAQFLTESLLMTVIATLLAFGLTVLLLPWFNQLAGKQLSFSVHTLSWLVPSLLLIIVVVGLLSGAYPALFLSGFQPVEVLKGRLSAGLKSGRLRNVLVVFQFTISVVLIVGVIVVSNQLSYIQKKDIGFNRSQVLVVKGLNALANPITLKKEVSGLPGVSGVTLSAFLPTSEKRWHNWGQGEGQRAALQTELWEVDEDYIPAMEMQLVKGRNFAKDLATDSTAIIINETAARMYGFGKDPLNKTIKYGSFWRPTTFRVVGVVRDFNFNSMHTNVSPLVMVLWADSDPSLGIRVKAGNIPAVLAQVKAKWAALAPQRRFEYSFMDEQFDALYKAEQRLGRVVIVLAGLAIFIACLGLFGLATYAAEQRTKEIGIRKVLGAGIPSILTLLSRDFFRLIVLSIGLATPLAWFTMHRWLQTFVYRTTISVWPFVLAAVIILCIAFITTFYRSFKAAVTNPIVALRTE